MNHEPANLFDLRQFVTRVVWAGVCAARQDPSEMKHRLMVAYEHGHLTFDDLDFLIPVLGLAEA